jgi:catalase
MAGSTSTVTAATPSNGSTRYAFDNYRCKQGTSTYALFQAGDFVYIKYHFLAKHGQKQLSQPEAIRISGENPDYSKQQLWEAIENGQEIEWTAKVQVMKPEEADPLKLGFDPFDVTKVWPRGDFPMHEFGRLVLNKNPENYHRDVEQAAFSPGSMPPGIEDSPDPLLQHRMWFYRDVSTHHSLLPTIPTPNNPIYRPNTTASESTSTRSP